MGRVSRNTELIPGVNRLGRSASSSKHQRYFHSKKVAVKVCALAHHPLLPFTYISFAVSSLSATHLPRSHHLLTACDALLNSTLPQAAPVEAAPVKQPRWYAADDIKKPLPSRKHRHKAPKLRSSITPGTVVILLAGRFKVCVRACVCVCERACVCACVCVPLFCPFSLLCATSSFALLLSLTCFASNRASALSS
jgi:hypothetical protein